VLRGGRPTRVSTRSDPRRFTRAQSGGTHLGFRANASPFAGGCGTGDLSGGLERVRARRIARCEHEMREGFRPSTRVHARQRGVRSGSRRGLARRKSARTFTRVGPVRASELLRKRVSRLVSSLPSPRGGGRRRRQVGGQSPLTAVRGTRRSRLVPVLRRVAETGRTPSGPEKRAIGTERVESPRGIRSA